MKAMCAGGDNLQKSRHPVIHGKEAMRWQTAAMETSHSTELPGRET